MATTRLAGALAAVCFWPAQGARAYEEDTHFTLTFVLCRVAGLTDAEALTVARYDQGMDESPGTRMNGGPGGAVPNVLEQYLWHALSVNGTADEVLKRKDELWARVLAEPDSESQLKRLGVFLHYQQDTWSHRYHPNSDAKQFTSFRTPLGHALLGDQPDRPSLDPVCALRCLEEGIGYVRTFVTDCRHRTPNPVFAGYAPAKGEVDAGWVDERRNPFFNELAMDDSTEAHALLTGLIRAQIGAYSSSKDSNSSYKGHKTANKLSYDAGRAAFQRFLDKSGLKVTLPPSHEKLTTLTSWQLSGSNLGTQDYTVKIHTGGKLGAGTDSGIYLALIGTSGVITEQQLNDLIKGNAFERDQTDNCVLTGLADIGQITAIAVRSDNSLVGAAWYLGWIEVGGPGLETRRFTLNDWIETGKLTRKIKADQPGETR